MVEQLVKTSATRFLSSYLVLGIDVIICIISFSVAYLLRFNFETADINQAEFVYYLSVVVGIRFLFFLLFRSYQGIIRHTSLEDVTLLVYAVTISGLVTVFGSFAIGQFSGRANFYIPASILLIDFFCCLVILSLSRFFAKAIYWTLRSGNVGIRQPVLIYGAGKTGLLTRKALTQDSPQSSQIRDVRIEDLLERAPILVVNLAVGEHLKNRIVLVTGAAGSIGSELVRQVVSHKPHTVVLLDQAESALFDLEFNLQQHNKIALEGINLVIKIGDVADKIRMHHIFCEIKPDFVFHAAAYKHVPLMEQHPYEAIRVNVLGTQIVADLSVKFGVRKFVMISTDKAVNPSNVMGATKRLAEMYVESLNNRRQTCFIVTRFGNVLGSCGSVLTIFRQQIQAGGPVTVTHPDISRYFMTISEACQLVLEAATMGNGGEVFVFDMGEPVRIAELARKMIHLSGYTAGKEIQVVYTGLRPGEKLFEELLSANEQPLPTHHPKIRIARAMTPEGSTLTVTLKTLHYLLAEGDATKLIRIIKQMIPEYSSENATFIPLNTRK